MLPPSPEAGEQNFLLSRPKKEPLKWFLLWSTYVLPPGIEPGALIPQTSILSVKLRELGGQDFTLKTK